MIGPVLVGAGVATQRTEGWRQAKTPLELMLDAVRAAVGSPAVAAVLPRVGRVAVPHGRWAHRDPGRVVARAIGAPGATTVLAEVGVMQQSLIGDVCERVAAGDIAAGLVVGGEAGHRLRLAAQADEAIDDDPGEGEPDEVWVPAEELRHPAEAAVGLDRAIAYYALLGSAVRHRQGRSVDEDRDVLAARYSRFADIAVANPHAWRRQPASPAQVRDPGPGNPMLASPYTRAMASSWSVDQAAALLVCSATVAREAGIPEDAWVHPWASAESSHMRPVCERADLAHSPGTEAACAAALRHTGLAGADLDLADLYSCFPSAVEAFARHLDLPPALDQTVTGGMAAAGGPYNNYVLQSTARMAELLAARPGGGVGVVTCVSGLLTKQGVAIWGTRPAPGGFARIDVTAAAERSSPAVAVLADHHGPATVAASTVVHLPTGRRAVVAVDVAGGSRAMASSEEPAVLDAIERDGWCGRTVAVTGHRFAPLP